ncbi:AAA family ATPase [Aneurinibacillus sp. Ricciae_BoGa-3]|uniref:AAA family ATPase n=1 Tax=Aneurinibacillus sp. Ricciae_BoGa-3 TaxID=3022697 RepID=UPI00233FDD65|nr:AAA family ATPase [Aneurinibacillus sp. Ricciae_BoGa-3]WCK55853.1 AAA family ATPase [Aneurinibacillus sp. Ricciae_BoGa-3]
MRIKSMHINGFGAVSDYTITGLSPGINVIEGRNEAGKTTIMSFIRSVLFGFASRNRSSIYDRYEPVNGGRHGGTITLIDDAGKELLVERFPGPAGGKVTIHLDDGTTEGEAYLQRLLGGISPMLFRSLFAFSLTELQQLEFIEGDEVSDYIYSAGMGAAVTRAEKWLDDKMLSLYRRSGQAPDINSLLRRIKSVDTEITHLKNLMLEYNEYTAQIEALNSWIEAEEHHITNLREGIARFEMIEKAGDTYNRLQIVRAELWELPDIRFFPEDGIRRLEEFLGQRRTLEITHRNLRAKQEKLTQDIDSLSFNPVLIESQPRIEALLEEAARCADRRQAIAENQIRMQQHRNELGKKMRQLGGTWAEEALLSFDLSLARREEVRAFRDKLNTLQQRARETVQEQERHAQERMNQEVEIQALSKGHSSSVAALAQDLSRKEGALREVRELYARMEISAKEQESIDDRIADLQEEADRLGALEAEHGKSVSPRMIAGSMFTGLLVSAFIWRQHALAGSIAATMVFILGFVWFFMQQRAGQQSTHNETVKKGRTNIANKISQLKARQEKIGEQYIQMSQMLEAKRQMLSAPAITYAIINRVEAELAAKRNGLENQYRLSEKISERRKRIAALDEQIQAARQSVIEAEEEVTICLPRWRSWLEARNLPRELSPEGALDMFVVVESCCDIVQQIRSLQEVNDAYQEETDNYGAQVNEMYERAGLTMPAMMDPIYAIRELKKAAAESLTAHLQYEKLKQDEQENAEAITACEDSLNMLSQALNDLLGTADCVEEEQFRIRARQCSMRQKKLEELQTHTHALRLLLGEEAKMQTFEHELSAARAPGAQDRYGAYKASLEESLQKVNRWRDERGALRQQLANLEREGTLSERLQEYEEIVQELKDKMREWSVYAACRQLLKQSREKYEQERQPGVIRNASRYFSQITEGKYTAVLAPLGEKRLLVQRDDGQRIEPGYLSRGTKEQLYLAIRFALAGEYASQCVLPLIMDDIFVNFDAQRLRSTLNALQAVAQTHQILLFTCHPHVTNSLCGEHAVIRIGEQLPVF